MKRFWNLFRREKVSREISREMDFHISERTEQFLTDGIPRDQAERQARRQFGAYALHHEDAWIANFAGWIESLAADVRYALRGFARSPGFASVAILSLALGIGANAAIFSLIQAVMLRSLPVSHPEELLQVAVGEDHGRSFTNPLWEQLRDRQDVFSGVFAWGGMSFNLATGGESQYVNGNWVSGDYFSTLGVAPALGRTLTRNDDRRGCPGVAVLSHALWLKKYGGDVSIVGQDISLNNRPFEIVGVTRPGFTGTISGQPVDVFVSLCTEALTRGTASKLDNRANWWLTVFGRPKPGLAAREIKARLDVLAPPIMAATVAANARPEDRQAHLQRTFHVSPAASGVSILRHSYGNALNILLAATGLVLAIACANVASLLLARSSARRREIAVRAALGARRARLFRGALTESLLLSLAGASLGLIVAHWGSRAMVAMIATSGNPVWLDLRIDAGVFLFTAGVATVSALLFGLLPAWRASNVAPMSAMKTGGSGAVEGQPRPHAGRALVVAQVALSLVLASGAGLLLATFQNLTAVDSGFRSDGVVMVTVDPSVRDDARRAAAYRDLLENFRQVPGVLSASISDVVPISNSSWDDEIVVEGGRERTRQDATVNFNEVSSGFFRTLTIPILTGRDFNDADTPQSSAVIIVNESLARKFFGTDNPLGRRIRIHYGSRMGRPLEVVGVAADAKYQHLRDAVPPTAYLALQQNTAPGTPENFEIRTTEIAAAIPAIVQASARVNPRITLRFTPLAVQIGESLQREKLLAVLSGTFAALALLLAAIGIYGLLSYDVARRKSEIGIRMAVGATQSRVLRMVLRDAGRLLALGLAAGMAVTIAATHLIATLLYGLRPTDPAILGAAATALAAVALIAAYVPARRAASVDPMTALRDE